MNHKYRLVELFSGIGSQLRALSNLGLDIDTVATCEWDIHAMVAYYAIHISTEIDDEFLHMEKKDLLAKLKHYNLSNNGKRPAGHSSLQSCSADVLRYIMSAIKKSNNFVDISSLNGAEMPEDIDILTYSFPCQDLSNVGAFHGYNKGIDKDSGSRSGLLWQVGRILKEMKASGKTLPRFLVMENVPTLLSKRHSDNFNMWIRELEELGYLSRYFRLNALDFGLPQNRPRLLMLSIYVGEDRELYRKLQNYFSFPPVTEKTVADEYHNSPYYKNFSIQELLRTDYSNMLLKEEATECTPNDTSSRRMIWENNPQIILADGRLNPGIKYVRTITTKQDRHPNSGNLYYDSGIEGRSKFRYLTPRECMLFMGFTDEDYENIKKCNIEFRKRTHFFPRDTIIRMAGNSIPVKLLEGIFWFMLQTEKLIEDYKSGRA